MVINNNGHGCYACGSGHNCGWWRKIYHRRGKQYQEHARWSPFFYSFGGVVHVSERKLKTVVETGSNNA